MGLKPCPPVWDGGCRLSFWRGLGASSFVAVAGLSVRIEEDLWFDGAGGLELELGFVSWVFEADLLAWEGSAFFRFLRPTLSFSAFSIMTLLMRSNSEQMPSIRCTPPVSISWPNAERNVTTMFINLVSDRARGSRGFCKMLPNSVTSAETGKYNTILPKKISLASSWERWAAKYTHQTTEESPSGIYLSSEIEALAAEVHRAAELKTLGFRGLELSPWIAKFERRLVQYPRCMDIRCIVVKQL